MNAIIIQPPIVQLNTAYPSGAYLSAFFKQNKFDAKWYELNIQFMQKIFCAQGLEKIFAATEKKALELAETARISGDDATCSNILNYIYQKDLWCQNIDLIMDILRGDMEQCHRFFYSPFMPRGSRMESFLDSVEDFSVDNSRHLATFALADIADYISYVCDKNFSLVRYAESIAINENSFSSIENAVDSPLLEMFYSEVLEDFFGIKSEWNEKINKSKDKTLVLVSVPFPGTFTSALYTGRFFKRIYGEKVFVVFGGGFINTELREVTDAALSKYADALSYDRGYGSYKALIDSGILQEKVSAVGHKSLYKIRFINEDSCVDQLEHDKELEEYENLLTSTIIPDYTDIDFSIYPRLTDSKNPMQRMWSDGAWLKAYLAHGCYWHKCSFCDVTLDYVKSYRLTQVEKLYAGLLEQCTKNHIRGIHFVDEALPPKAMKEFVKCNLQNSTNLLFWGNVRFEKVYTKELVQFLSLGGLTGVSGGIEIATGTGLDKISKGTDLNSIVSACCAFKEAGVLVHAYMIFGYFGETDQDIINSMETLRQFFALGLIDSCFWHKFVLTRHSRLYDEYKKGLHPDLVPLDDESAGMFAKNGMHFRGEEKSEKFSQGLNASLESWMHGENIDVPVNQWFNFKTPLPTVSKTLVEDAVSLYEENCARISQSPVVIEKSHWLRGKVLRFGGKIKWNFLQEIHSAKLPKDCSEETAAGFIEALSGLSVANANPEMMEEFIGLHPEFTRTLTSLRGRGLVVI